MKKKPSTSELFDWLKLLAHEDLRDGEVEKQTKKNKLPPVHGALLKNEQDVDLVRRALSDRRRR